MRSYIGFGFLYLYTSVVRNITCTMILNEPWFFWSRMSLDSDFNDWNRVSRDKGTHTTIGICTDQPEIGDYRCSRIQWIIIMMLISRL
jgi:hypothetical protein